MEKKKELENLLVSVSENDDYAFRVFYDLYYRSVFRFAYYFLRNREACGEVVSNVFVAVWKSRVALRRIENIDAYLYVVARNEANRYLKESRTRRRCLSFEEIPISLIDRNSPPHSEDAPDSRLIHTRVPQITYIMQIKNGSLHLCRDPFFETSRGRLRPLSPWRASALRPFWSRA